MKPTPEIFVSEDPIAVMPFLNIAKANVHWLLIERQVYIGNERNKNKVKSPEI